MKLLIFLVIFIFLISFVSANEIGISPSKIDFAGKEGDVICNNIELTTKDKEVLTGEDRWSAKDSKELKDYNLRADSLGIEIDYIKRIEFKGNQSIEVCLRALESGTYHGALIYQTGSVGVGTWININISDGERKISSGIIKLTGNVISEENSGMFVFAVIEVLFLVIIFLVLIYIFRKIR